jgi:hypothetical protein
MSDDTVRAEQALPRATLALLQGERFAEEVSYNSQLKAWGHYIYYRSFPINADDNSMKGLQNPTN